MPKQINMSELMDKGKTGEGTTVKDLVDLLQFVHPDKRKNAKVCLHWFTIGYGKRLGSIYFDKWPFPESEEEFTKKYDSVFFLENVNAGTLIGWTRDRGRYENFEVSDATKRSEAR